MTYLHTARGVLLALATASLFACSSAAEDAPETPPITEPPPAEPTPSTEEAPLDFTKVILEDRGLPTRVDPNEPLMQSEALEDVRFLEFFIRYGYAARAWREAHDHVDYEATFGALKTTVRGKESWTAGTLFDEIRSALEMSVYDAHMSLYLPGAKEPRWAASTGKRWTASVASAEAGAGVDPASCKSADVDVLPDQSFVKLSGNVKQLTFVTRSPVTRVTCGAKQVPVTELPPSAHVLPSKLTEKELDTDTYYVRLPSFSNFDPAQATAFIDSATHAKTYATVVLDLRGNPGGNPNIFFQWLEALGASGTIKAPPLVAVDSFAATVLGNNVLEALLHGGGALDPQVRNHLQGALAEHKETLAKDLAAERFTRAEPIASDTPHFEYSLAPQGAPFAGEVRILVDARCASACEFSAQVAKQLPRFYILSDTNTRGAILSGDPGPIVLPASKTVLAIPLSMISRPDQWAQEGHGIAPDVWLDTAAMAALYP